MNKLTVEEINLLLLCIDKLFGRGYSSIEVVVQLQAKLSVLAETQVFLEHHTIPRHAFNKAIEHLNSLQITVPVVEPKPKKKGKK